MPIEQLLNALNVYAFYTYLGAGQAGLNVTVDIWEVTRAGVVTQIVNNGVCTAIGGGLYYYRLAGVNVDEIGEYLAHFTGAGGSMDVSEMASTWTVGRAGVQNLDGSISAIPAGVWSYTVRTLTQSAAAIIAAVEGATISVYQYNTWSFSITGLGNISTRVALYFTAKEDIERPDESRQTIIQIEEKAGLVWIDGEAATNPALGSLVVNDAVLGNVTVTVDETVTDIEAVDGRYDFKMITAAGVAQILTINTFHVLEAVTRAVT